MAILIHHLHVSQSERILWLCEELGVDYELKTYTRSPLLAPPEYKALHPMGTAPVIQDGDLTLAESCACIEYISHRHAGGKLFLPPTDPAYPDFLYWWHWADGTFQSEQMRVMLLRHANLPADNFLASATKERFKGSLQALDERLGDNEWLAGKEFTVADIMIVFSITTMRFFYGYSLAEYGNIVKYLERIGRREAYRRAMKRSDPDMEPALGAEPPKPFVPRSE
ncbi:Glutathione S-transferase 3 [Pleurostoma richardsiae]|uniref:Glutathione S-transferase 3 n=1 Tax=Pleurostoma richardsiae TaxID=41990 RepID=A0AA38VSX6_9PEZI|nr:Glutathione S-transferase 3 [Pleurostoma richardsiae]